MTRRSKIWLTIIAILLIAAVVAVRIVIFPESATLSVAEGMGPTPQLPPPDKTLVPTVNIAPIAPWSKDAKPTPAQGLSVAAFAQNLDHPRWLYKLPNGDILVAETNTPPKGGDSAESNPIKSFIMALVMERAGAGVKSPNRITLLRDTDGDGVADHRAVFLDNLYSPFGMALIGNDFYVADANALMRFPYKEGETSIIEPGAKVVDLPAGINHHWTKNILPSPDGKTLYITVGSNSNVGENGLDAEKGRAAIWELDLATNKMREFATGLRNPNGMAWEPTTHLLWTVVNERDEIGSDLVPDYMTAVRDGAFYGWPYSYYGQHVDARVKPQQPDLVARAIAPDYALGPHTASLGLTFSMDSSLPQQWRSGAVIGQHGSWNRRPKSGYKVIYVPFVDGKPAGSPIDMLAGFLNKDDEAQGRPVGVILDQKGALLVADDVGNRIWRVTGSAP